MNTNDASKAEILHDADVDELKSMLLAEFYQTWDLDEKEGMPGVIDRVSKHSEDQVNRYVNGINKILNSVEQTSSTRSVIDFIGGDYDPKYDGLTKLEWLILVKYYFLGYRDLLSNFPEKNPPSTA